MTIRDILHRCLTTIAGDSLRVNVVTDSTNADAVTALQIMDDWDESDRAKVNPIVGQAGVAAGSGAVGATTQRVTLATDVALPAGTNAIGNVGLIGRTSGGMSIFRSIDLDESQEEVKATAGQVFSISAFNRTAAPVYLKFYNATAANVTVGTTTPVLTFVVPANADSDGAGFIWNNEIGFAFSTAITVAATTGVADNNTGAPGANDCIVNIGYV